MGCVSVYRYVKWGIQKGEKNMKWTKNT